MPQHRMTLLELCQAIDEGYESGKCGLDDSMLPLLIELGDRTAEIRELTTRRFAYAGETKVKGVVCHLVSLSCWFKVTPLPFDYWEIEVKDDVAHLMPPSNVKPEETEHENQD